MLAFVFGAFSWTFAEYTLHRWAGHHKRLVRISGFGREHTRHHAEGGYFAPAWKKALFAGGMSAVLFVPAALVVGASVAGAFVAGFVGAWLAYEWLHWRLHVSAGVGAYGRFVRKHHFFHHFHDPSRNHGVTTPIWDLVFGTYARPDVVRVPEKLAMPWLRGSDGSLRPELAADWALRGRS
jgi:sterol desaturase/sphingolipid hydroxylase (fatty acid hydroxylase superfamily)